MNKIFNYCEKNKIARFIFDFCLGSILFIVVGALILVGIQLAVMFKEIIIWSILALFTLWMIYGFGFVTRALLLDKVYPDEKFQEEKE